MYIADASGRVKRTKIVCARVLSSRPREATGRANPNPGAGALPLLQPPRHRHIACPGEAWSTSAAVGSSHPLAPGGGACRLLGTERGIAVGHHSDADRRHGKRWWRAATTSVEVVARRNHIGGGGGARWRLSSSGDPVSCGVAR
jgi:hypothetical protein